MKRLIIASFVLVAMVSLPLSHLLMSAPAGKVKVCHNTGKISDGLGNCVKENGFIFPPGTPCGVIIEVSQKALPAHCRHGDRTIGALRTVGTRCNPLFVPNP